jgi:hypothetical protein
MPDHPTSPDNKLVDGDRSRDAKGWQDDETVVLPTVQLFAAREIPVSSNLANASGTIGRLK